MNPINIFYEANHALAGVLSASIVSVCKNTKEELGFFLLDTGLFASDRVLLTNLVKKFRNVRLEIIKVDLDQFRELRGYREENFVDCYARLLIPNLVPSVDKAIYLDTDTIVLTDIKELWDTDMEDNALAAPPDTGVSHVIPPHMKLRLGILSEKQVYISAGVYLMDCQRWRDQNITERLLALARKERDKIVIIIEDLFTMYFRMDFKILDPKWGFIEYQPAAAQYIPLSYVTPEYLKKTSENVAIIHFAGQNKVWKTERHWLTSKTILYFNEFWNCLAETPYYEGMCKSFLLNNMPQLGYKKEEIKNNTVRIKLFNRIPFIKIKVSNTGTRYYLFNFLPILKITRK